jgi:hypothetical protein
MVIGWVHECADHRTGSPMKGGCEVFVGTAITLYARREVR